MLSKKDLVTLNQEFHTGHVVNEGSLAYVLDATRRSKNWLKTAALLTRAILLDHVFEDGNKRTAAAVVIAYLHMNGLSYNSNKINALMVRIAQQRIRDLKKIEWGIKNVIG